MSRPERVRIVEVGPRDGLQNEATPIPTAAKIGFVHALADAGLHDIEVTSFVHPKRIPQLADAADVLAGLDPVRTGAVLPSALVPNERGLERALESGVPRIAVFTAASELFTQANIGMSIGESLEGFASIVERARAAGVTVRGYVSTAFVCPYAGEVDPAAVVDVTQRLLALGVDEVAVSDTLGAAAPTDVERVLGALFDAGVDTEDLALHLHDTYGTALANVDAGLRLGITTFDASAGGLGGCPYAPGAAGNLATEDLVYFLERMGIPTGIDGAAVVAAARSVAEYVGRPLASKQAARLG